MNSKGEFVVSLGRSTPSDCTLCLSRGGYTKEYLIESDSWRALSFLLSHPPRAVIPPTHDAWAICSLVWWHGDSDCSQVGEYEDGGIDLHTPIGLAQSSGYSGA